MYSLLLLGIRVLCDAAAAIVPMAAEKGSTLDIFTVASELQVREQTEE